MIFSDPIHAVLAKAGRRVTLKRRLPSTFGSQTLYVSPDSALRYWRYDISQVDPALLGAAQRHVRKGDTVLDVGANVGLFTFSAAWMAGEEGQVIAVEADPAMARLLELSANVPSQRASVEVLSVAASDHAGIIRFCIAEFGRSSNHVEGYGMGTSGGVRETKAVPCLTVDTIAADLEQVNVLKIDVEGYEVAVLQGARQTLERDRPRIILEVSGGNRAEVGSFLKNLDYRVFDLNDVNCTEPITVPTDNVVALP